MLVRSELVILASVAQQAHHLALKDWAAVQRGKNLLSIIFPIAAR